MGGPDFCGAKKLFGVAGETGDLVKVILQVGNTLNVTIEQKGKTPESWSSLNGLAGGGFSISSDWSKKLVPMAMGAEGVYTATCTLPFREFYTFQILKDEDSYQAIHPEMEYAGLGQSKAMGPDNQGHGLGW